MPITAFNSFSDGLAPSQRSREHCIADIDLEDGPHWVPYANGVWIQLCHFNATSGGLICLDKAVDGGFAAYEDGFTALELARKYYREAGLDVCKLDARVS